MNTAVWSTGGAYRSCLAALTDEQRKKFLPLCPDFVVEPSSPSDSLCVLQDKMRKYIENEAPLAHRPREQGGLRLSS